MQYSDLQNVTMTLSQCNNMFRPELKELSIATLIALLIVAGFCFFFMVKYVNLRTFIRDNKLEKKYQEHRADQKGLL
jgi:hypothetical protein